jgi:hypothetical protein
MGVGVEDFFSVVMMLALLLLAILWCLIQCCGELGRLNSSGCSCVLVFLCSWWLTQWSYCRWTARVWLWKVYIWCSLALPGRQLGLAHYVTHCWCVCVVLHAHSMAWCWACTQAVWAACVCVYTRYLVSGMCLAVRWSARQSWSISSHFHYSTNLPIGIATWHNVLFCFVVCRESRWESSEDEDHQVQD